MWANRDGPEWTTRAQAFASVERPSVEAGGRRPWATIDWGFAHDDERIEPADKALGKFKPRQMSVAFSMKTTRPRVGRARSKNVLLGAAVEVRNSKWMGRHRIAPLADASGASLRQFVTDHVRSGETVIADGW